MRIALIAPPFIPVPPPRYGGTELFLAQLARGLRGLGEEVVLYANGESRADVELRSLYPHAQWPIEGEIYDNLKDLNHTSWSLRDAARECDVVHVNNVPGVVMSRLVRQPMVYTMHHPHLEGLSEVFRYYPGVQYVTISEFQRRQERMPRMRTIYHGLDFKDYRCVAEKEDYLAFIGRIAPVKGVHLAIAAAQKCGIPLKIAGEVQPMFREYFHHEVKPHIDGTLVQYVGEANLEQKNELLGRARAMLFPIQWDEPFGLVMIEAMACGTPVLALAGGSVPEVVQDGVSGFMCRSVEEMAERARTLALPAEQVRAYAEERFALDRMVRDYRDLYRSLLKAGGASDRGEAAA